MPNRNLTNTTRLKGRELLRAAADALPGAVSMPSAAP